MELKSPVYVYDGKLWVPDPTVSDNNSFFHSAFGCRSNENNKLLDEYTRYRRGRWSGLLNYYTRQDRTMPSCLADTLRKCLAVTDEYKHISLEDKDGFAKYIADIESGKHPIKKEELLIPVSLENVKIVVVSDTQSHPLFTVQPNFDIIGDYSDLYTIKKKYKGEFILNLKGNIFSRLKIAEDDIMKEYQVEFLTKHWMHRLRLDDSEKHKVRRYSTVLVNAVSCWMETCPHLKNYFVDVKLQMEMLAEVFETQNLLNKSSDWEGCKEYLSVEEKEPNLPEYMNFLKLYEMYFARKRDVFIQTQHLSGEGLADQILADEFEEILASCRTVALEMVIGNPKCELFSCYRPTRENIESNLLKIGIVEKVGHKFHFTHKTFSEYFVAESAVTDMQAQNQSAEFQRFLFEEILSSSEFNIVCAFIDNRLQTISCSLPSSIFQNYQSLTCGIDLSKKNTQCILHQLAKNGCLTILQLVLKTVDFKTVKDKKIKIIIPHKTSSAKTNWNNVFENSLKVLRMLTSLAGVNIEDEKYKTPLHYAAQNGYLHMVKFLVDQGANLKSRFNLFYSALHLSTAGSHFDIVKFLVEHGMDINYSDDDGNTAVHLAIANNRLDIVQYLLEHGGQVNACGNNNYTPLHVAASNGELDVAKYLIEKGADINLKYSDGPTALHVAVSENHPHIVELLVKYGANVNFKYDEGCTPLHLAVSRGSLTIVEFLVRHGADYRNRNNKGEMPLHLAVSEDKVNIAIFLLQNGANPNFRKDVGCTLLHSAISYDAKLDIIKSLVQHGAYVNIRDEDGCTPLYRSVWFENREVTKFLLDNGADANITNNDGFSPLHYVANVCQMDYVKFLLEHGADINARDSDGPTALHLAVFKSHLDVVRLLVEHGADTNIRNNRSYTPLHIAADEGRLDIAKVLVDCGRSNLNVKDKVGRTPLQLAVDNDHFSIVNLLVQSGADVNSKDMHNNTALYQAVFRDYADSIKFLVENGASLDFIIDEVPVTALQFSASRCRLEAFKFLVERNADFNASNACTLLCNAATRKDSDNLKYLLDLGVNVNSRDEQGRTALHFAAEVYQPVTEEYRPLTAELLIERGIDINARDKDGRSALHAAAERGYLNVLKLLIEHDADVNAIDNNGRTILHKASLSGRHDTVKYLLETDFDANITDNFGCTALHLVKLWRPTDTDVIKAFETNAKTPKRRRYY